MAGALLIDADRFGLDAYGVCVKAYNMEDGIAVTGNFIDKANVKVELSHIACMTCCSIFG